MSVKTYTPGSGGQIEFDTGAITADTQRMTLATDDPAVAKLTTIDGRVDGLEAAIGATTDAEVATGNGSLIAILKRLRSLMSMPGSNTQGNVTVTTSSTALIAANTNRERFALYNSGLVDVYVGIAATPTTSLFAFKLAPGDYYESPWPPHTGAINGIVASGTCVIQTSEWT